MELNDLINQLTLQRAYVGGEATVHIFTEDGDMLDVSSTFHSTMDGPKILIGISQITYDTEDESV
jgi:hypothetical protein